MDNNSINSTSWHVECMHCIDMCHVALMVELRVLILCLLVHAQNNSQHSSLYHLTYLYIPINMQMSLTHMWSYTILSLLCTFGCNLCFMLRFFVIITPLSFCVCPSPTVCFARPLREPVRMQCSLAALSESSRTGGREEEARRRSIAAGVEFDSKTNIGSLNALRATIARVDLWV